MINRLAERVRKLEMYGGGSAFAGRSGKQNQDLTLTVSVKGSTEVGAAAGDGANTGVISPTGDDWTRLNKTTSFGGDLENTMLGSQRSQGPHEGLAPDMMQELFFDCIKSLVKSQRNSQNIAKSGSTSPQEIGPAVGRPRTINQILQTKKQFDRLADVSKQEVLIDFVQNKAVL